MVHVYGQWFQDSIDRKRFMTFMKARFARLYPLHLFTFLYILGWVIVLWTKLGFDEVPVNIQKVFSPWSIPTNLLLIQAWGMHLEASWNLPAWSISVEWFLYLVFPFMFSFLSKSSATTKWILAGTITGTLLVIMYVIQPIYAELYNAAQTVSEGPILPQAQNSIDLVTGFALLRGLCGFVSGMLIYELYRKDWQRERLKKGFWFWGICGFLIVMWSGDWLPDVFTVGLFSLLILHAAYVEGWTRTILNNRVCTYLGDISYSIYMVHIPIMGSFLLYSIMNGQTDMQTPDIDLKTKWVAASVFMLLLIGIASLTYRFIEKPMRRWLKRNLNQRS